MRIILHYLLKYRNYIRLSDDREYDFIFKYEIFSKIENIDDRKILIACRNYCTTNFESKYDRLDPTLIRKIIHGDTQMCLHEIDLDKFKTGDWRIYTVENPDTGDMRDWTGKLYKTKPHENTNEYTVFIHN
jgi:hypothetical protein